MYLGSVSLRKKVKFSPRFNNNFAILIIQPSITAYVIFEELSKTFGKHIAFTAKGILNEKRINELWKKYFPEMKINLLFTNQETFKKITTEKNRSADLYAAFYLEETKITEKTSGKRYSG